MSTSTRRWGRRLILSLAGLGLVAAGLVSWALFRPHPDAVVDQPLFTGVRWTVQPTRDPRPQVLHLVSVDLDTPGLRFLVTPGAVAGKRPYLGQTTGDFLEAHGLSVAINGGFFDPFWSNHPLDYYPETGQPVTVFGLSISGGQQITPPRSDYHTLFLTADNQAWIARQPPPGVPIDQAISGRDLLVQAGQPAGSFARWSRGGERHPRSAVGLSQDRRTLLLVVADGRQPRFAEGLTLPELIDVLIQAGAWTALLLDGGGSTTLVRAGASGEAEVLNSPAHTRIPGRQRPVGNHLGLQAPP